MKGNDSNASSGLWSSEHTKHNLLLHTVGEQTWRWTLPYHKVPFPSYKTPRVLCHMLVVSLPRPQGPFVVLIKEQFSFLPEMPVCFISFPSCLHQSKDNTLYSLKSKEPSKSQNEFTWKWNHTVTLNHWLAIYTLATCRRTLNHLHI